MSGPSGATVDDGRSAVDERLGWRLTSSMAVQHVVVMIAGPIATVFLIGATLDLPAPTIRALLCATLLACGLGTILQSMGWAGLGARLPFVMLPGGAAVVLFLQIATASDPRTATGAVLMAAVLALAVAPLAGRLVHVVPPVVIATMIVVIGINLMKVAGGLVAGGADVQPEASSIGLAGVTIAATVLLQRLLPAGLRRGAVLLGMAVGSAVAAATGHVTVRAESGLLQLPQVLPFGTPRFDLLAAVPLLIFALASMAEAAGQTTLNAQVVGAEIDTGRTVTRVIRADALTSLFAGTFGGQTMITSGENIGIVRATRVRSRYVTAAAGVLLVAAAFVAPLGTLVASIPGPVIGGTAAYVFAMVVVTGLRMFVPLDMDDDSTFVTAVAGLTAGLLPILAPSLYTAFPQGARLVLSSGVTMSALVGVAVSALFLVRRTRALSPEE